MILSVRRYSRKASDRGIRWPFRVTVRSLEMSKRRRRGRERFLGVQEVEQCKTYDLGIGSKSNWIAASHPKTYRRGMVVLVSRHS